MSATNINKRMQIISDLQIEANKLKMLYEESLDNNAQFQEVQEESSKMKQETKQKMEKILLNSTYQNFQVQLKDLGREIKENKEILAQNLVDYYKETGNLEVTDEEGNAKRIKFSARLINA